jgi:hypothetical protein
MKRDNILDAVVEAQNFIDRARELLKAWDADGARFSDAIDAGHYARLYALPKQSGAVKRASMDPTRALAKMRQGC